MKNVISLMVVGMMFSIIQPVRAGEFNQSEVSDSFMLVELKMAQFKGTDTDQTHRNAEAFLAEMNYKILSYQDNEAVWGVDVALPQKEVGMQTGDVIVYLYQAIESAIDDIGHISLAIKNMRVASALRKMPNVSKVEKYNSGANLRVIFKTPVYETQVGGVLSVLPPGSGPQMLYYSNYPEDRGLRVHLDVSGLKDPHATAGEFLRNHPNEVASAEIATKDEGMRVDAVKRMLKQELR